MLCAAMPHARKPTSTTAANGFIDQEPKEDTTAVVTGSTSSPATTAAGFGMRERHREGVQDHQRADAQQREPHRPRHVAGASVGLLGGGHARVEADEDPATHSHGREQRGEGRPARERLGAERVPEDREVLLAEDEQQREPDPDRRDSLGRDPGRTARLSTSMPKALTSEHTTTNTHAGQHDCVGGRSDAEQGQRPRGAQVGDGRVRHGERAERHPAVEPAVARSDQPAAPLVGAVGDRELARPARSTRTAAGTARRARPAAPTPTRARRRSPAPGPPRTGRRRGRSRRSPSRRCRRPAARAAAPGRSPARAGGRCRRPPGTRSRPWGKLTD